MRIAQEAFANSVRHAKASRIELRLTRDDGDVVLEILDDGLGFDLVSGRSKGGLGLQGMEERARRMGGRLTIHSEPGEGTRIKVRVGLIHGRENSKFPETFMMASSAIFITHISSIMEGAMSAADFISKRGQS